MLVGATIGGLAFGFLLNEIESRNQLELLANYRPSTPTRLFDRYGRVYAELFRQKQEIVPYQKIPRHVTQAFLAVEDDNFYHHFGIDLFGILRAAIVNLKAGHVVQGGSTLTQQLAKQIYLNAEGKRERSFKQKIREMILAFQMEEELSKEEILEVYFNVIYLGHGCKGIACASRLYFDKSVEDLSLAESAILARMPKSPVEYSPFKNPARAKEQHMLVLRLMEEQGFIPPGTRQKIHDDFWADYWGKVIITSPSRNIWSRRQNQAPFFVEYVRQMLEATPEIGPEKLYTRGYNVYTTLDLDHQRIAEEEVGKTIGDANRIGKNFAKRGKMFGVDTSLLSSLSLLSQILPVGQPHIQKMDLKGRMMKELESGQLLDAAQLLTLMTPGENEASAFDEFRKATMSFTANLEVQGAFLNIEPKTGYITAMIGGKEFSPQNQFNRALMARRQPGSAFKIFVYGAGIERRVISSGFPLNDAPLFTITSDGTTWSPGNYDQGFRGLVSASTAMALSLNTCAVQTYFDVGPDPIIDFAGRLMKISNPISRFNPNPALALGASEVTPMELATAISIIANEGKDVIPYGIKYVSDQSGNIIYNQESLVRKDLAAKVDDGTIQIIEPGVAYILKTMMRSVADHGTATRGMREISHFYGQAAAKTGTTSSWSDAWIVGFNPEYASVFWTGFDKSSITLGPGQAGGHIASPVLGAFLRRIYQERKEEYPKFAGGRTDTPPPDVIRDSCNGYGMRSSVIDGRIRYLRSSPVCAGSEHRIFDQRELLMKELGITAEDLGVEGNVRFKSE